MSEHQEQKALFEWANRSKHKEAQLMFAIPNGGHRHKAVAAKLKAEGVKAGVPDICLPVARGGFSSLFIELKTKTGTMQKTQIEWQIKLNEAGNMAVTCKGWEQAKDTIENYLRLGNG
jgi:hypothetical protein